MREVVGYEGHYSVTEDGRVWSHPKNANTNRHGKWLTRRVSHKGYYVVSLTKDKGRKYRPVHRLVAEAYVKNVENKSQVNHIDGDKKNNHFSNLEWVTNRENTIHAYKTGLRKVKMTQEVIEKIRELRATGMYQRKIAQIVGTDQGTVSKILNGKVRAI